MVTVATVASLPGATDVGTLALSCTHGFMVFSSQTLTANPQHAHAYRAGSGQAQ